MNNKNKSSNLFVVILSLFAILQLSLGAGFDCKKAATVVEKTICSDKTLSELDDHLTLSYKKALKNSSHKNTLKITQRDWLRSKHNKCNDDRSCLKTEYRFRIMELINFDKDTSLSGRYKRYYQNKPSFHPSDIDILELKDHKIYIYGVALWYGDKEKGIVHIGEIEGSFALLGDKIHYQDEYGCSLMITFGKNELILSESTPPPGCGGINVTFDGQYRKSQ